MKNRLLLILVSLLCTFLIGIDTGRSSNEKMKIFFEEINNSGAYDSGSKYYFYDLKNKSKKEVTNKHLSNVFNGTPRITSDGKYLFYFVKENQKQFIKMLDLQTNSIKFNQEIPMLASELRISNDLKYLTYTINKTFYEKDTRNIFLLHLETKEITQITNNKLPAYNPVFSPTNDALVFLYQESFRKTILKKYYINNKTIEVLKIFPDSGYTLFQWLDGDKVLLTRKEKSGTPFILDLKTGKMTDLNLDKIYEISISPDGKKMVYLRALGYDDPSWDLYVSDIDGRNVIKIPYRNNIDIMSPQWVIE